MHPARYKYHYLLKNNGQNRVYHREKYPDLEWAVHMVTEHDFIYAWLDGQFYQDGNHSIHETSFEEMIDDYSTLIDFIQSNMTFANPAHTCLLGYNIGAHFVLNSLSTSTIKCGIAISPFIDWNHISKLIIRQFVK